jgi:type VI secretion system secreted protein VgrG
VPRIGMEVIVQFVDGDPDRPLVTGCVYNADNALPYPLPEEKTKSTIKSRSTLGGGGFNELRFEDKKGAEEIWLHAQRDHNERVLHDHSSTVDRHEKIRIGVDRTIDVGANFRETVGGSETRTVKGSSTETVGGGHTRTVSGGSQTTVDGGMTVNVVGGVNRSTVGPTVEKYAGGISRTIVGDYVLDIPTGNFKVKCGETSIEIKDGEIILTSPTHVKITSSGGDVKITGGPNVKLNCA